MAERVGMLNLINRVRGLIGDPESVVPPTFEPEHIQDILDRTVMRFRQTPLLSERSYASGGQITYQDFMAPWGWGDWEEDATFQDASYTAITPDPDPANGTNYIEGVWHFTASHPPPVYMALGKTYDVYAAASVLCREWAGIVKLHYSVSGDGRSLTRSDKFRMLLELAHDYDGKRRPQQVRMRRADLGGQNNLHDYWRFRVSAKTPR
jgi:hypothetical protein